MPGGRTKFSAVWLLAIDSNGQKLSDWCKKGKDDYHGYCNFCAIDINVTIQERHSYCNTAKRKIGPWVLTTFGMKSAVFSGVMKSTRFGVLIGEICQISWP